MITTLIVALIPYIIASLLFLLFILELDAGCSSLATPKWRIRLNPIRNFKTNWAWDRKLNELLDDNAPIKIVDQYHAMIGDQEIWLENFPYASFSGPGSNAQRLPTRKTAVRLTERLMQHGWVPK